MFQCILNCPSICLRLEKYLSVYRKYYVMFVYAFIFQKPIQYVHYMQYMQSVVVLIDFKNKTVSSVFNISVLKSLNECIILNCCKFTLINVSICIQIVSLIHVNYCSKLCCEFQFPVSKVLSYIQNEIIVLNVYNEHHKLLKF